MQMTMWGYENENDKGLDKPSPLNENETKWRVEVGTVWLQSEGSSRKKLEVCVPHLSGESIT